jgi:ABC-type glycerol-3-phosphate transport system permease component
MRRASRSSGLLYREMCCRSNCGWRSRRSQGGRRRLLSLTGRAVVIIAVVVVDFPILTVAVYAFQPNQAVLAHHFDPGHFTAGNFALLGQLPFTQYVINSLVVSAGGAGLALVAALLGGYALSRFRQRALAGYARLLLIVQMVPVVVTLLPLFLVMRDLRLLDTYIGLILIYAALLLPFATWIARAFLDSIPLELEEAAWVDGCTRLRTLARVVGPLAAPGIASIATLSFITAWNEYLLASVFLTGPAMTVSVGLQTFTEQIGPIGGAVMGGSVLAMIPSLAVYLIFQRYFVSGALAGAVKG